MGRGVPILTARLGQDPYGFLGRFQALKYQKEQSSVLADEVFRVLAGHKATSARISSAIVSRLEASESFADAKANIGHLERVVYWDAALSERCRNAISANSQVRESWGVPERIEALVVKYEK